MTGAKMVNVGAKPIVERRATAEGTLVLRPGTIRAIQERRLEKGDALEIARTAAILAAKRTPETLPLCHPIPLDGIDVTFEAAKDRLRCRVEVRAHWRTGVEMEALVAATTALLTVWDIVKPLEKDEHGQYPTARISDVRVVEKVKA